MILRNPPINLLGSYVCLLSVHGLATTPQSLRVCLLSADTHLMVIIYVHVYVQACIWLPIYDQM